eukprot:2635686-Karenia_brevis.AAC.1
MHGCKAEYMRAFGKYKDRFWLHFSGAGSRSRGGVSTQLNFKHFDSARRPIQEDVVPGRILHTVAWTRPDLFGVAPKNP